MSSHKCGGSCCKSFTFPFSPGELKRCQESINDGSMKFLLDNGSTKSHFYPKEEVDKLVDMLIFQTLDNWDPQKEETIEPKSPDVVFTDHHYNQGWRLHEDGVTTMVHKYTCKHFDKVNELCGNYENRPQMCHAFPGAVTGCHYKACQGDCATSKVVERLRSVTESSFEKTSGSLGDKVKADIRDTSTKEVDLEKLIKQTFVKE